MGFCGGLAKDGRLGCWCMVRVQFSLGSVRTTRWTVQSRRQRACGMSEDWEREGAQTQRHEWKDPVPPFSPQIDKPIKSRRASAIGYKIDMGTCPDININVGVSSCLFILLLHIHCCCPASSASPWRILGLMHGPSHVSVTCHRKTTASSRTGNCASSTVLVVPSMMVVMMKMSSSEQPLSDDARRRAWNVSVVFVFVPRLEGAHL